MHYGLRDNIQYVLRRHGAESMVSPLGACITNSQSITVASFNSVTRWRSVFSSFDREVSSQFVLSRSVEL